MLEEQDNLYYKIKIIVPDSIFSLWKNDNRHLDWDDSNSIFILLNEWCINWEKKNKLPCPTLEEINKVTNEQITAYKQEEHLRSLEISFSNNPIYKFCYLKHKEKNPKDSFRDFLIYINQL